MKSFDYNDSNDSHFFLTDIDIRSRGRLHGKNAILEPLRKEHSKIQDLVQAFRSKVDLMIDRQRSDFAQAYEYHIYDVHKELHYLREKVNEIANDKARNEKMQHLDSQQNLYRSEALRLDVDTTEMQKRLRSVTAKIQSIGKK
jgi:hypothetical protein